MRFLALIILLFTIASCQNNEHEEIESVLETMFQHPDNINDSIKTVALDLLLNFADAHPEDEMCPEYMFRAANISRSFKKYEDAIQIYQRIVDGYPEYNMRTESHFLIAFVYENDLGDKTKATEIYEEVAKKYPSEKFGQQATLRLQTIHMSDDEMLRMFQEKNPELKKSPDSSQKKSGI